MSHVVAALFEDHAQASAGLQALLEMGIAQNHITAIGLHEGRDVSSISGFRDLSVRDERSAALHGLNLPAEDERLFERGLLSGYALVAAQVSQDNLDRAIEVLGMFGPLNLDQDSRNWADSHTGPDDADQGREEGPGIPIGAGLTGGTADGMTNTGALPGMGMMTDSTDELGTADLRTDETAQSDRGLSSTTSTGQRREDGRAEREGVNELQGSSPAPGARTGPLQRAMNRGGRVWAWATTD